MKYINKYIKFFESDALVIPSKSIESVRKETATESDVLSRFEELYSKLSKDEKDEINKYFEK